MKALTANTGQTGSFAFRLNCGRWSAPGIFLGSCDQPFCSSLPARCMPRRPPPLRSSISGLMPAASSTTATGHRRASSCSPLTTAQSALSPIVHLWRLPPAHRAPHATLLARPARLQTCAMKFCLQVARPRRATPMSMVHMRRTTTMGGGRSRLRRRLNHGAKTRRSRSHSYPLTPPYRTCRCGRGGDALTSRTSRTGQ